MLIFINTLIGILVILSISICLVFKSVFACLMAFAVLFVAFIGAHANKENKYSISNTLNLLWLILCESIAFAFKFIVNINVFKKFSDSTFKFVVFGIFVLAIPHLVKLIVPQCNNQHN